MNILKTESVMLTKSASMSNSLEGIKSGYGSPRWSGEITDCAMPMTFDTYSKCSYGCLYCFAVAQQCSQHKGLRAEVRKVNEANVMKIFTDPENSEFGEYVKQRITMQWGGMSDPFDEYERKHGITLKLLKFFKSINYPLSFSTKGTWWTKDRRYLELFQGQKNWNVKVSIITDDADKARHIERGVDSPADRLKAIEAISNMDIAGVTLRFRPFIIGVSSPFHVRLINSAAAAAAAGATAVSTEFLCVERRLPKLVAGVWDQIGEVAGYDLKEFYKTHTKGSGYLRLNRDLKKGIINEMEAATIAAGMRFYVSDAHLKERCNNGCCCGLPGDASYSRYQWTEALQIAKDKGSVTFSELYEGCNLFDFPYGHAAGFNQCSSERRSKFHNFTMLDYLRFLWNDVNGAKSPYKYFGGILYPAGKDDFGNVIYKYDYTK